MRRGRSWGPGSWGPGSWGPGSWGKALHDPAAALLVIPHEAEPVVQPVGAALPELHAQGGQAVATPDRRPRHPALPRLLVEQPDPLLELVARVHDRRLHGG